MDEHQVIYVDFKEKKKIDTEKYVQYTWYDCFNGQKHIYDSRRQDNVEHFWLENVVAKDAQNSLIKVKLATTPQAVVELAQDLGYELTKEGDINNG